LAADGSDSVGPRLAGEADWAWEFYNSDRQHRRDVRHGARCFARFVQKLTGVRDGFSFLTGAGVIHATFQGERVTVNLTSPRDLRLNQQVTLSTGPLTLHFVNTGVPHAVLYVPDTEKVSVRELGGKSGAIRTSGPKGTNANFVQVLGRRPDFGSAPSSAASRMRRSPAEPACRLPP
jgi:diaminopimelate epimerase